MAKGNGVTEKPIRNPQSAIRNRKDPYQKEEKSGCYKTAGWVFRLGLLLLVMTVCLTAALIFYSRWLNSGQSGVRIEGGSPSLNPVERLYLQTYLAGQAEQLQQPVGGGVTAVSFTVNSGESANQIAANLAQTGLLPDTELFLNYLRFYGLDSQLEAGDFLLDPDLTIPDLAATLTDARTREITLRFIEGWRLEEMSNYLRQTQPANIDADQFEAIAQQQTPFDLSAYDFLSSLPSEASLEGFLFPDTYRVPLDADAAYLVDLMLANFGERATPAMRQAFGGQGLSLREAVTLASIVYREAVVDEERPLIAGVFLNRLSTDTLLQADPTVQYALGYQPDTTTWWKNPLYLDDLKFDSPYNTYIYSGLPPGPIANPGLAALEAVANPIQTDFVFFVADCQASVPGRHLFSVTFKEHLANVERCR
ncbi:MAG: endolytic transglycosylase MltG [Chloroflexi bacterium]|nr:endolytic transglycosylase MltG [Chloroflexota bacterium]